MAKTTKEKHLSRSPYWPLLFDLLFIVEKAVTKCNITDVGPNSTATLTCNATENIIRTKNNITIYRFIDNQPLQKVLTRCFPIPDRNRTFCSTRSNVSSTYYFNTSCNIIVEIPSWILNESKTYGCNITNSDESRELPCYLRVDSSVSDKHSHVVLSVSLISLGILLVVVALIIGFWMWIHRNLVRTRPHLCRHDLSGQDVRFGLIEDET